MARFETHREAVLSRLTSEWPDLLAVYLFGSEAAGRVRPDSDVDLALLAPAPLPAVRLWDVAQDLAAIVRRTVELLDLRQVSTVAQSQVVTSGRRVYCSNPGQADAFETFVLSSYARLNEERREILRADLDRGSIHGG